MDIKNAWLLPIKRYIKNLLTRLKIIDSRRKIRKFNKLLSIAEVNNKFPNRNLQYKYFHHFFWNLSPGWLKEHRHYFSQDMRGFGEDAFHAMWYFIFSEFHPKDVLEIGIYRGQTLSLFSLLGKNLGIETEVHGISPFTSSGDGVSNYLKKIDYYNDVITNVNRFNSPMPVLHKGFSTDEEMIKVIRSKFWDVIYIDGNHDYEVAKQDFDICSQQLKKGGLIVLDDSSLYTDYIATVIYSSAGHPGPSRIANEIDEAQFREILKVGHNRVFQKIN